MGRAIDQDNRLDSLERDVEMLKGVVEELSRALVNTKQTKHVDLHATKKYDPIDEHEKRIREENAKDEEFTPPAGKRKKTTSKAKKEPKVVESLL